MSGSGSLRTAVGRAPGLHPRFVNSGKQVRELQRVLAEKTLEVDFFKGALQKVEARRQSSTCSGGTASTT